jgi:hypothetical protein
MRPLIFCFLLSVTLGCQREREQKPEALPITDAGPGNYCQLGPVGLSVESARLGKIRMRGMLGQDGESKDAVFAVKLRFKQFDTSSVVKQPALQRDGMMLGGAGFRLKDENGREFRPVGGFGFDTITGRRSKDVILVDDPNAETTDVLTFESTADAAGELTLEVPANYQIQQPNDAFLQPKQPGTFRFRIPRSMWDVSPPSTEAKPGNWSTVGAVSMSVEGVRVGKAKMKGFMGEGESQNEVFAVTVRVKLADPKAHVKKPPFITDGVGSFITPSVTLKTKNDEAFAIATAFGIDRFVGRHADNVELSADKPELTDLLTFDAKAAKADEVFLTLWPKWQEKKPDGSWVDGPVDGEFRFRIPKSMWAAR